MRKGNTRQLKIICLALIIFILTALVILFQAISPMRSAKKQSIKIAKEVAGIESVEDFYWFTRDKSYFTIVGKDDENEQKVVFLPEDGTEAIVMKQADGIRENEAIQKVLDLNQTSNIKKISLGLFDNQAVWEVVADGKDNSLNYYLVAFKDGEIVNTISEL